MGTAGSCVTGCGSRTSVMAGTILRPESRTPLTCSVLGLLAFCYRQRRDLSAEFEAGPGDRLRPDSVGDPSSPAVCADSPRSGAPLRGRWRWTKLTSEATEFGLSGGRAQGKKILTCIAIEILEPKGFRALSNGARGGCLLENRFTPSCWITSSRGRRSSPMLGRVTGGWTRTGTPMTAVASGPHQREARTPENFCKAQHRIASLAKRWLMGTHQGAVDSAH